MKDILHYLYNHHTLSRSEANEVLKKMASGHFPPAQMASFLTVFNMRGITLEELQGFREALLDLCHPVDLSAYQAIDLCGTGGDGKDTFNISTLSAFVVAGAGIKVAKHGNYGSSSICGSSNVLQAMGVKFTNDQSEIERQIEKAGICVLHAPLFHPAMKEIAPVRKELGMKTFFNMLGPMVNPARPQFQIVGVFNLELARKYQYLYQDLERTYTILHSLDGYDEISLTGKVKMIRNESEAIHTAESLGFAQLNQTDLAGGDSIEASAGIFQDILRGRATPAQRSVVLANSAAAIQCAKNIDYPEAVALAAESLDAGKALQAFETLINLN